MIPPFEYEELLEGERTLTYLDEKGIVRKALKEGSIGKSWMSMDEFIDFPVKTMQDWKEVKKRYNPCGAGRFEPNWNVTRARGLSKPSITPSRRT